LSTAGLVPIVVSVATALLLAFAGVFGLVVGSFLNVVIWRVPRGESVVRPRSACPGCEAAIRPRDNVPVLSWLLLRRRCRDCGAVISARYPAVELVTAAVFVVLAARVGAHAELVAYLYLGAVAVALAAIDVGYKRLPDVLTLPSYAVGIVLLGIAALAGAGPGSFVRALISMAALFAFYLVLVLVYPAGMGLGDVKLSGLLGLYLGFVGWGALVVGAFAAFLVGGVVGVGLLLAGAGRKARIPFGPYMLAGALIGILAGQPIWHAYLHGLG
jgi:leader peptidase (prepilin peptidase)/N-methyltransferase